MTTTLRGKIKRMSVDYVIQHNSLRTFVKCNKISNSITITTGTCNNTQMAIKVFTTRHDLRTGFQRKLSCKPLTGLTRLTD